MSDRAGVPGQPPQIVLVAAMASNRAIGLNNQLLWHLPDDFQHFKTITMGLPVLMGRLTWESIARPLPGRTNIVLTRNSDYQAEGCVVVTGPEQALALAAEQGVASLMVIGGAKVYDLFLDRADALELTLVDAAPEADAYFPELDERAWKRVSEQRHDADERHQYAFRFVRYERRRQDVLRCNDPALASLGELLDPYGLQLERVREGEAIAGSFWGDEEAGLIGHRLLLRPDTPVHSALHEAAHYVCMDQQRREGLHTDAGGGYDEENGVCYLQILWSGQLPGMGRERMFADMDAWGYSFRLGSAQAWFEQDAEDALQWLQQHGVVDADGSPTGKVRAD